MYVPSGNNVYDIILEPAPAAPPLPPCPMCNLFLLLLLLLLLLLSIVAVVHCSQFSLLTLLLLSKPLKAPQNEKVRRLDTNERKVSCYEQGLVLQAVVTLLWSTIPLSGQKP